jgi:hypothetical protein
MKDDPFGSTRKFAPQARLLHVPHDREVEMEQELELSVSIEELRSEKAVELPSRHLLATISVLGLPLVGVSDVAVNVDTTGPGWLISG